MKSWTIRAAIVVVALGVCVALATRRPVPDASADTLANGKVSVARVFEQIPLKNPVWMQQPPGDPARWIVVEQAGRLVTFANDPSTAKKSVALDITDRVESGGELGLLGLAFHPKFSENGFIFVNYTTSKNGPRRTQISRFTRRGDGNVFDPGSEVRILSVEQPYSNHNGGQVAFGPDGFLYIAFGDGGLAGDPDGNGQNTSTLLGGIARIDVDGKSPYAIPPDNPFADGSGGAPELYAWGLRNPWRFSFDSKTGELWAGDVGQNAWEEVDIIKRGKNYGWNIKEGTRCYDPPLHLKPLGSGDCGSSVQVTPPILEYSQAEGDRSITGGYVYRGSQSKSLVGNYVYGDFMSGRIWAYDKARKESRLLLDTAFLISTFVEAADGEIGVIDYGTGAIYHLRVDETDQRQ